MDFSGVDRAAKERVRSIRDSASNSVVEGESGNAAGESAIGEDDSLSVISQGTPSRRSSASNFYKPEISISARKGSAKKPPAQPRTRPPKGAPQTHVTQGLEVSAKGYSSDDEEAWAEEERDVVADIGGSAMARIKA